MNRNVYEPSFVSLLSSQQFSDPLETNPCDDDEPSLTTQCSVEPCLDEHTPKERSSRRKWSPIEDLVLISAWQNTSKDAVVGNEQKGNAFWERITSYYHASPKLAGLQKRESGHCKQRWQKINDQVCKFVGSYEAATTQKSSGQNEDDVMKVALDIFFNDYKVKFSLEHAWRELRHDQKWCSSKGSRISKRRKLFDGSPSSQDSHGEEAAPVRPPGVKAAKAKGKRPVRKPTTVEEEEGKDLKEFQSIWELKEKDYALKQKQSKLTMLENLIAKTEPLSEIEMELKNKLITDMLSNF